MRVVVFKVLIINPDDIDKNESDVHVCIWDVPSYKIVIDTAEYPNAAVSSVFTLSLIKTRFGCE